MKKIVFALLWGIISTGIFAQNTLTGVGDTLKMSLQDCIDFAIKNNVNIKNSTLDEEIAAAKVREIRGIGLPQISGSVGLQHYFKLRNSYFGANSPFASREIINNKVLLAPDPGQPINPNNSVNIQTQGAPILSKDAIIVYPNIFQLPSTIDASLTASQILFNASYIVGLQAARTYKELSKKSTSITKEQTANNVKKAYYQQMISLERIKLYDLNIARLDSTIKQTIALQKNGFVEQIDVQRLEVTYNNLLTEYEKSLNLIVLASLMLKYQMGMPIDQNLILTDSIQKFTAETSLIGNDQVDVTNRNEYQLLKLQKKASELDLKNNRGAALPSLILSGSLGVFNSVKNADFFSKKTFFVYNPDNPAASTSPTQSMYWSDYSFIQLGLNVPIFSGLQRTYKVQQSKLSVQKADNSLKNFEQTIQVQIQSAKVNLQNSQRSLKIQQRNLDLAKNVSVVTYKKYKAGTSSNLEVTTAEASLKESQINYFNALYDYLVYKVDFETAAGLNKY